MSNCQCSCHAFHLAECTKCYLDHSIYDTLTFTDSAIRDRIVDYFNRFAMINDRIGSFYFPLIHANALLNKETQFDSEHLKFIDYLFLGMNNKKIRELFHTSIINYIAKYHGYYEAHGLNEEGQIKWSIIHGT